MTRINIGNHEVDDGGSSLLNSYLKAFGLTSQYYSFKYQRDTGGPKVHVLTMATEQSFSKGSAQYNFVKTDLSRASKDQALSGLL